MENQFTQWNDELQKEIFYLTQSALSRHDSTFVLSVDDTIWTEGGHGESPRVEFFVPRGSISLCSIIEYEDRIYEPLRDKIGWFEVSFREIIPELVKAKPGDFVLIYRSFYPDDQCDIGLVTCEKDTKDGIVFGCSFVQFNVEDRYNPNLSFDRIYLTEEDHGGYHDGFIKILSKDEVLSGLKLRANVAYNEAIDVLQKEKDRIEADIDRVINFIAENGSVEEETRVRLSIKMGDTYMPQIPQALHKEENYDDIV